MVKNYPHNDCAECAPKDVRKHDESKIIFSCGKGLGANIPVYGMAVPWQPETVVGTVSLDTGELKNPSVKIDFSSVVAFKTTGPLFEIAITFQLSRACNHGAKVPLTTITYEREVSPSITTEQTPVENIFIEFKDPIAFTWCDCHDCPGCCTYFVEIVNVNTIYIDYAVVGNVGINALAVSGK